MSKRQSAVLVLSVAVLLGAAEMAAADCLDPCNCVASIVNYSGSGATSWCYFSCPMGDTQTLKQQGFGIQVEIRSCGGQPIPGIPESDFWLIDCDPQRDLSLCGGTASSSADSVTNEEGKTTMTNGSLAAGGWADGISPVCQGLLLVDSNVSCTVCCWNVHVRSPDLDGDLSITLIDLAIFTTVFPPQPYDSSGDFDCNGVVGLTDLALFAIHFGPPGHGCNP